MADIHGSPAAAAQNPQANNAGSAPVPYAGADQSPEPPDYAVTFGPVSDAGGEVMSGIVAGNSVMESAGAHAIDNSGGGICATADAPYYPGPLSPIFTAGADDAGGRDNVSGTVAGAVAAQTARWHELEADILPQGTAYGDYLALPPSPLDPGVGSLGITDPMGAFYDPPREYT